MNRQDISEKVIKMISDISDADEITEDSELMDDLDVASMDVLAMCGTLEEMFGISIPEKLMRRMNTVGDIIDVVSEQIN